MVNAQIRKLAGFGVLFALLVVSVGAYTRLADAGLGCPDWPGCYGEILVPTDHAAANAAYLADPRQGFETEARNREDVFAAPDDPNDDLGGYAPPKAAHDRILKLGQQSSSEEMGRNKTLEASLGNVALSAVEYSADKDGDGVIDATEGTAVVVLTEDGVAADLITKYRPPCPVFVATNNQSVMNHTNTRFGQFPVWIGGEGEGNIAGALRASSIVAKEKDIPFHGNRVIDVSRAAATELGLIGRGHGTVALALLEG